MSLVQHTAIISRSRCGQCQETRLRMRKRRKKYHLIKCIPNRSEQEIDSVEFLIYIFMYKTGRHGINCVAIKYNTIFSIADYHPLVCVAAVAEVTARSFSSEWVVNRLFCSNTCTYTYSRASQVIVPSVSSPVGWKIKFLCFNFIMNPYNCNYPLISSSY